MTPKSAFEWQVRKAIALALLFAGLAWLVATAAWGEHRVLPSADKRVALTLDANGDPVRLPPAEWGAQTGPVVQDVDDDGTVDYLVFMLVRLDGTQLALVVYDGRVPGPTMLAVYYSVWDATGTTVLEWAGDAEWDHHPLPRKASV